MTHKDVHGWFDFEAYYAEVAENCPTDALLVEVGVWLGKSIICLAEQIKQRNKQATLFAVDTWRGSATMTNILETIKTKPYGYFWHEFIGNTRACGVSDLIVSVPLPSVEAARYFEDQSVYMVFIDADHTYASVKADIAAWLPKVKPGGLISGHDYEWAGVAQAVHEYFIPHRLSNGTWVRNVP